MFLLAASPAFAGGTAGGQALPGHVPDAVKHLTAKGVLPATNRLNLAIGLPLRNQAELEALLARISDPASPDYRHYLTPAQFTARFGPTVKDYQAVADFARRHHLTVTHTHGNRLLLDVNGTVADIQQAFNVTLKVYRHPSEARDFYAPDTEPSVEAGLAVSDISGLNNYARPHPRSLRANLAAAAPRSGSGTNGTYLGNDFRAAYLPGVTLTGVGQQLGLLEFDGYYPSDITAYETAAGLPLVPMANVYLDGYDGTPTTGSSSGNPEVSLDIEMAACMAPGLSRIVMFEAGPNGIPNDVLNAMVASNTVSQFSSSWGWAGGPSTTTDNIFREMAAQGQSYFNAAGDSDAFTTGRSSINGVDNPELANYPSSSPYVIEVGGTTLTTTGPGGAWSAETAWNWGSYQGSYVGTSGGISSHYSIPAWQAAVSMSANGGSTTHRNIPDVALTADNIDVFYGSGTVGDFGGTSCATPLWAGLAALINEQLAANGGATIGFVNPALYTLCESSAYATTFHDITTGNNEWPDSPSNYVAVAGYDLCTGWGTPAGPALINALAGPPEPLGIPESGIFTAAGLVGGPFTPGTGTMTITNTGTNALNWAVSGLASWLNLAPASGTLLGHGNATLTVSLTPSAAVLPAGNYTNTAAVEDLSSGVNLSRSFALQIGQSVVQNGGFETGDFTDWILVGDSIQGNLIYDAVEAGASYPDVAYSGDYGAFLGDTSLATLSQTLNTQPGASYLLSFWYDNPATGAGQAFLVNWITNSSSPTQIYYITNPPVLTWTNLTFVVAATGTNTTLQFGAANPPNFFGLDDVSATPIPAPSFTTATRTAAGLAMAWYSVPGINYVLQYSTNLAANNWQPLSTNTAATFTLSITNPPAADSQRFYRVQQLP